MKISQINTLIGIEIFILFFGFFFAQGSLTKNIKELFIAALGLLTFISIFYSILVSGGLQIIRTATILLEKERNKLIGDAIKKLPAEKDKLKLLTSVKDEVEKIDSIIDSLNLNKWLFAAVFSYLLSIIFYLVPPIPSSTLLQIISFWIGISCSTLIVSSWFAANLFIANKSSK